MIEIVLSVLAALGGGAIIIAGFAHWLGKLWASRLIQTEKAKLDIEIEAHKIRLKKSEFIFEKEYQATSEFISFSNGLAPLQSYPQTEVIEFYEHIASKFLTIETELNAYVSRHGAIVPEDAMKLIYESIAIAGAGKYETMDSENIPSSSLERASNIVKKFDSIEKILKERVHGQIRT